MSDIINRESHKSSKGFTIQPMRAALMLLRKMRENRGSFVVAGIEIVEDVFIQEETGPESKTVIEEDKNYSSNSSFSLNSDQVLKTFISFIDQWIKSDYQNTLTFILYSTNKIAKENLTATLRDEGIKLPKKPILKLIQEKRWSEENLLPAIRDILLVNYAKQYEKSRAKGNLEAIKQWEERHWATLFENVEIITDGPDQERIMEDLCREIKQSEFFNSQIEGNEEYIARFLISLLEERKSAHGVFERVITRDTVENIFLKIQSTPPSEIDPAHIMWEKELSESSDRRNLKEKLLETGGFSESQYAIFARKATMSKLDEEESKDPRSLLSVKYWIFDKCNDELRLQNEPVLTLNKNEIYELISRLEGIALETVKSLPSHYDYSRFNMNNVRGVILNLFDECYLSFNLGGQND